MLDLRGLVMVLAFAGGVMIAGAGGFLIRGRRHPFRFARGVPMGVWWVLLAFGIASELCANVLVFRHRP